MKKITFFAGVACMVTGLYLTLGAWSLIAAGLILTLEARGLPE